MMTVMFLQTSFRIGGAEMMWVQLIERLDRRRFRPIVSCLYEPGPLGKRLGQAGISVYAHLTAHRWDLRVFLRLARLLRREHVDVLYMSDQPLTQFWGTVCGRLVRVPVLMSMVQSSDRVGRSRRRWWINRLAFPFVDRISAVSETHRTYLCQQERIDPGKIEIIPNAVDVGRFARTEGTAQLRRDLGITEDEPIVGIVATLKIEKAHEVFLQAAASVLQRVPKTRFLIVGDGPQRPTLEALAKRLGLEARVHFVGTREDIPAVVGLFDIGVLSSKTEALPLSVLEYMAAGKPVVATRVGSIPELIEEGQSGFVVEPGDWRAIAERIIRLLQDPALANRMGRAGREKVMGYSMEQIVKRTETVFERLLNHR